MHDESWQELMAQTNAKRRRRDWQLTPEERLALAEELTRRAMESLQGNPHAYQAYLQRQHRKRNASSEKKRQTEYLREDRR